MKLPKVIVTEATGDVKQKHQERATWRQKRPGAGWRHAGGTPVEDLVIPSDREVWSDNSRKLVAHMLHRSHPNTATKTNHNTLPHALDHRTIHNLFFISDFRFVMRVSPVLVCASVLACLV